MYGSFNTILSEKREKQISQFRLIDVEYAWEDRNTDRNTMNIINVKMDNRRNWQHRVHKTKTIKAKTQHNMWWIQLFSNKHK